jgi:penicillin-binding protein 1C
MKPRPHIPVKNIIAFLPAAASMLLLLAIALLRFSVPPNLERTPAGTVLLDRYGSPLRISLTPNDADSRPVDYASIPPHAVQALIAAEDQRFMRHAGIDPLAIARALAQNIIHGRRISGASTISTQIIRLAEPRPRTLSTKLIECLKALRMERHHDKPFILEQYFNRAPFGGNLTGIESAARIYFDKSAADLTLAEAALLAGLPQAPSRLRPDRHPEAARRRMQYVLDRMQALGFITASQRSEALRQPISVRAGKRPFRAPHFCDLVLQRNPAHQGPLRTTLDPAIQHTVEDLVVHHFRTLSRQQINDAAVVVLDVETASVRAMIGSPDYFNRSQSGMFNSAFAARSPGSALKPFIYALAFDQGMLTPGTTIPDTPMHLRDTRPNNFDNTFRGQVTAREALILSLNIPALRVTAINGLRETVDLLRSLGLQTLNRSAEEYGLHIALGSCEVTLLDLVNAYACLAREGIYQPCRFTEQDAPNPENTFRVFSPEAAFMITDILGGEERSLDLFGHLADADLPRFAWKTGTSSGFRDAWTIAWNPRYVVGVWLGNHDGSGSPALIGAQSAAPLAGDIFRALERGHHSPWYTPPAQLRQRTLADGTTEWYIPGISIAPTHTQPPAQTLRIVSPVSGAAFRLTAQRQLNQRIALRADGVPPDTPLHWFANGDYLAKTRPDTPLHWPLKPGTWHLTCVTPEGIRATTSIQVSL